MTTDSIRIHAHTDRSVSAGRRTARADILLYGVASYLIGVVALLLLIAVSLGVMPLTGAGLTIESPFLAALFNVGLLVAFAAQHSIMARKKFKERWVKIIHPSMERSTYLLATAIFLIPLLLFWQPLGTVLWDLQADWARLGLRGLSALGWAYLFMATFAINHFELFGLQQSWLGFRGRAPVPVSFRERWMYRFDRHPIMTGVLFGLWATPTMTVGYLLFAAGMTLYVMVGVHFEERALRRNLGDTYEAYRSRVGTLVPLPFAGR